RSSWKGENIASGIPESKFTCRGFLKKIMDVRDDHDKIHFLRNIFHTRRSRINDFHGNKGQAAEKTRGDHDTDKTKSPLVTDQLVVPRKRFRIGIVTKFL